MGNERSVGRDRPFSWRHGRRQRHSLRQLRIPSLMSPQCTGAGALAIDCQRTKRMLNNLFSLQGRVALVTGGSRGIGKMIARGFTAQGARVYITARKAGPCEATAKELSSGVGQCITVP